MSPFQFPAPDMDEVQRLFTGFVAADWGYQLKEACNK